MRPSGEKRTDATPLLCPFITSFSVYGKYSAFLGEGIGEGDGGRGDGTGVVSRGVMSRGVRSWGVAVELREDLGGDSLTLW